MNGGGPEHGPVPPPWDARSDLLAFLAPSEAAERFREAGLPIERCERGAVRLKPGGDALVAFGFRGQDGRGTPEMADGYVSVLGRGRAATVARKWDRLRPVPGPLGAGVRLLPGGESVLFLFPNDRQLRGLRFIAGIDKVKRTLGGLTCIAEGGWRVRGHRSSLATVRYKPERRFIARALLALKNDRSGATTELPVFLRFYADDRGRRIDALSRTLRERGLGDSIPEPLGALVDGRLFVERAIEGQTLHAALLAGAAVDPSPLSALLRRFHGTDAGLPPGPDPEALREQAVGGLRELARCAPDLRAAAQTLDRLLGATVPEAAPRCTIHGDLHPQQVLLTSSGPCLIDFERTGLGDPLQDLGNLAANLRSMSGSTDVPEAAASITGLLEALLEAPECIPHDRPASDLAFFEAVATVELALLSLRRLEPAWPAKARALLEHAAERLESTRERHGNPASAPGPRRSRFFARAGDDASDLRGFRWEVFHPRPESPWTGWIEHPMGLKEYGLYHPATDTFETVDPVADPVLGAAIRSLPKAQVVSFRPGRRAVLRSAPGGAAIYYKVLPPPKAGRLRRRIFAAEAMRVRLPGAGFGFARLVEDRSAEGILGFEELAGRPLHDLLMDRSPGAPAAIETVARSLAGFHSVDPAEIDLPPPPERLSAESWLELARPHLGELVHKFESTLVMLPSRTGPASAPRPVHGDLHDRNLLVGAGPVGILDLDLLHVGDPAEDAGNLAAHLLLRALQRSDGPAAGRRDARRFLKAWRAAGGPSPRRAVETAVARTLFRLAVIHHFRRRWRALVPALLRESSRWSVATSAVS